MPVYQHRCPAHGAFDDIRPFAESGAAAACPVCGAGCSHHHRKPKASSPPKAEVYRGPRPWVIEHG